MQLRVACGLASPRESPGPFDLANSDAPSYHSQLESLVAFFSDASSEWAVTDS
jgi:hypothetical protein